MSKKSHHFLTLWPWPLTYDLEKLIRSGHYHYQCVYQIWEQSIPWFLSYRVNTIAGGGRLWRKTITSPVSEDIKSDTSPDVNTFRTRCLKSISIASLGEAMMSWHGNPFHFTGPLWGESTGDWWVQDSLSVPCLDHPIPIHSSQFVENTWAAWFNIPEHCAGVSV